ncbi:hypothetical protein CH275_04935 [Rhodococcus sp. 06-235-1A]|uniref:hypothetical protein n=1 Tax=Rhodococcus sp. 06-235-1A TaxID=2022508 RepID=UPI000B9B2988|nr:hypothetical protein [Rhodococcus sp. 06-235-1A]OZD08495.1 hypothetical protein CH275_04935 [Rhodococcus sp. 06-235-1A]
MATYHLSQDLHATSVSVRLAHASPSGEARLCIDIGEDLSVYLEATEWAALADMADAALDRAKSNHPAGKKALQ